MKTIIIINKLENLLKFENYLYSNLLNYEIIKTIEINFENSSFLKFTFKQIN